MYRRVGVTLLLTLLAGVAQAGVLRPLTDARTDLIGLPRWSDDGTLLFVSSSADLVGTNPDHRWQVFRFDLTGNTVDQLTTFPRGILPGEWSFAVSDDGGKLALLSRDDPLGLNPDRSAEVFTMNSDGSALTQVTQSDDTVVFDRLESSGDGGRLVFGANADYSGQNPGGRFQIYTVLADGSGMLQLTGAASGGFQPTISDDGERVAYLDGDGFTLRGIRSDGSGPRQLTTWFTWTPTISGDGDTVVFLRTGSLPNEYPGWCFGGVQVGAVDWAGTNPVKLSGNCLGDAFGGDVVSASVTDDGQTLFHAGVDLFATVRRIQRDAGGETALILTGDWQAQTCSRIAVAGGGSRFAAVCRGLDLTGGNGDLGLELYSADSAAQGFFQHTATAGGGGSRRPGAGADGDWVFFSSDANLLDEVPHPGEQLYRVRTDGAGLQRLSDGLAYPPYLPRVTGDGGLAVFNLLDTGPLFGPIGELWLADAAAGTSTRITATSFFDPDIDAAGSWIVAERNGSIYRMRADGSEQSPLAVGASARVSGDGQFVAFVDGGDVRRMTIDGTDPLALGSGSRPEISHDGSRVVFASTADPLGLNADGNSEIFLAEVATGPPTIRQLTSTTEVSNENPAISGDGAVVYHVENRPAFPFVDAILRRVDVSTLGSEDVPGLLPCVPEVGLLRAVDVDFGSRAVFASSGDCTGHNPDANPEIVLADAAGTASLRITRAQPTRVEWDVVAGESRYDLIAGELPVVVGGGTVDLGAVTCLADDLPFNSNLGEEDAVAPDPGRTRFYLVRELAGPGYATSSDGSARVPSAGDCP